MIAVYIIVGIVLILTVILLLDISLVFTYKEKLGFTLKLGFISLSGSKIIELAESSESNETKKQELIENKRSVVKKKKSPSDVIDTVSYIIDLIGAVLGEFTRYARIKFSRVKIGIGSESSAETALIYGFVSSALYSALEVLDSFLTVKKNYKDIGVYPDFTSEVCKIDIKIVLKIKIIRLLFALIHLLPNLAGAKKGK